MDKDKRDQLPELMPKFKDTFPNKNNQSGVKGVYLHKGSNKWTAKLTAFGEEINVGYFDSINEAEEALNQARNKFNTKEDVEKFKVERVPNVGRVLEVDYFKNDIPSKNNKSGVKGVYWHKRDKKWIAVLYVHGKKVVVGYFDNVQEAEKSINEARNKL